MAEPELYVQPLERSAWEDRLELEPAGEPVEYYRWLRILEDEGAEIRSMPVGEIAGGQYAGGRVIAVYAPGGRYYFVVPEEGIRLLGER